MPRLSGNRVCLCLIAVLLAACSSTDNHPTGGVTLHRQNEGYSLLYNILSDESQVGSIFILKHADDSVGDLVRQVGDTCKAAKAKLESFASSDPDMDLKVSDLPDVEQRSRDLTQSRTARQLLFADEKDFEIKLIFAQSEAMGYATELCRSLQEHEKNPARKEFLKTLGQECDALNDRLMALVTIKPQP